MVRYPKCQTLISGAACRAEHLYAQAAAHFAVMLFSQRMRTPTDQNIIREVFSEVWGARLPDYSEAAVTITPRQITIGRASLHRSSKGKEWLLLMPCTLLLSVQ